MCKHKYESFRRLAKTDFIIHKSLNLIIFVTATIKTIKSRNCIGYNLTDYFFLISFANTLNYSNTTFNIV